MSQYRKGFNSLVFSVSNWKFYIPLIEILKMLILTKLRQVCKCCFG